MVACVLSQNLPELTVKLNKDGVHVGTLQFLEQILRTGESQQSHHPLWLNVRVTEKLCDPCPCILLVNWNRLSWQYLARTLPHANEHKTIAGSGCFLSGQTVPQGDTCYVHAHPMNWISVQSSCLHVSTCSHYFYFAQLQKLYNVSHKHIRKLLYFPAMRYTLSICALFYFLYLTDFHCTEK
jgi:hypothetical protein